MAHTTIRGVIAPNLTPFHADLSVDKARYVAHARHLLANGCAGLAPFGTTGEALSVGIAERMDVLEALIEAGVDPARLIVGTGLTSLPDTARLTRHAVDQGVAGAMILPPFYYKNVSEEGLYAHYARLIEMVGSEKLAIYLYHIPQVSGVGLPVRLVARLREAFPDTVVGIKDSSGDWENTRALLAIEGLTVYPGNEMALIEAMGLGAPGCITATANLNGEALSNAIHLIADGRLEEAEPAMEKVKAFRAKFKGTAAIPAQKRLLALASGEPDWAIVRPPLDMLAVEAGRALAEELEAELGFSVFQPAA